MNPDEEAQLRAVLAELESAWCAFDFTRVRALWDERAEPVYLAEEAEPHLSWQSLERYWEATRASIERVAMRIGEPRFRELGENFVTALYPMHWDAQMRGEAAPIGGEVRVCAVLRRTDAGWRFVQYVEAPLAPILYMRRLYRLAVDPAFVQAPTHEPEAR